jgi:membrane protein
LRIFRLRHLFWGETGSGIGPPPLRLLRLSAMTLRAYHDNNLAILASGLSFYLMLSVVPFLAYLSLLLRAFGLSAYLEQEILIFVAGGNQSLVPTIEDYIRNAESGLVEGVGMAITFVLGYILLQRVKVTLNVIWKVERPRGYPHRLAEYVVVLIIVPLLLALALGVSGLFASVEVRAYLPRWLLAAAPSRAMATLAGYAVLTMICFYAYLFLPDNQVRWRSALAGALVSATGLVIVQRYSMVLILGFTRTSPIYGALAVLPFVMLWFYIAWMIFLAGAQVSYVMAHFEPLLEKRRGQLRL